MWFNFKMRFPSVPRADTADVQAALLGLSLSPPIERSEDSPSNQSEDAADTVNLLTLPNEVIEIITTNLYDANMIRSLASLSLCSKRLQAVIEPQLWRNVTWKRLTWAMASRKDPSGWQMVEYIVYEAGEADFWKGLKADLSPEEHNKSWESALLKRWPNLKAAVETTSSVPHGAKCPVHTVWISLKNALDPSNAIKHNPLDRISKLIYGSALSVRAKNARKTQETYPHLTANLEIKKRISLMSGGSTIFNNASLMTGLHWGNYPFIPRSEASRLTDNCSYGFDLYVLSNESASVLPRLYGSAEHVAFLCWLSREALQSAKFELNVACDQWIQIRYWLETLCLPRGIGSCLPFTLRIEVLKRSTLEDFGNETLRVDHLAQQAEMLGKVSCSASSPHCVDVPNRIIVQHHGIFPLRPMGVHAEIDLTNSETAGSILYVLEYGDGDEASHTGDLERITAAEEAFEAWLTSTGEPHYWIE